MYSIVNGKHPKNFKDTEINRWTSWNKKGEKQSIDFTFEKPTDIKAFSVYCVTTMAEFVCRMFGTLNIKMIVALGSHSHYTVPIHIVCSKINLILCILMEILLL